MAITIIGFVLGLVLGSFVKALADRSLNNKSFLGRSYCPECKHVLGWYDLFPLFSFLILKGRCRYCQVRISWEYFLVELSLGILIAYIFSQYSASFSLQSDYFWVIFIALELLFKVFFVTVLAIVFITDLKETLIPDRIILPSIIIAIISLLVLTFYRIWYLYHSLSQSEIGQFLLPAHSDYFARHLVMNVQGLLVALVTGLSIGAFFLLLIIVTRGKGMGGGDVKLGAFLGLVLSSPAALLAVMVAFVSGAVVSLVLIAFGKKSMKQSVPFGPFLVFGSLLALFWGGQVLKTLGVV